MKNDANRWIAGMSLLSLFAIIACAGTRSTAARQTTQNVLVTNTSSQQVPVLPAARPGPGGAYIVAVNNAPSVKVINSPTAPVVTKDTNNPDVNGAIYTGNFAIPAGYFQTLVGNFSLSSLGTVIDSISFEGSSVVAGECLDFGRLKVLDSTNTVLGTFSFTIPTDVNSSQHSGYLGAVHIPVPPGGSIALQGTRYGGTSNNCQVYYTVGYHTVPNP